MITGYQDLPVRQGNAARPATFLNVPAVTGAALVISLVLEPWIEPDFSPLFLGAVTLCSLWWGRRAAFASTLLSLPALLFLYLPPHNSLTLLSWHVALRLLSFLSTAALIIFLVHQFKNAQKGLVSSLEEVRTREERFRVALIKSPVVVFHQNAELRYIWVYNPFPEHANVSLLNKVDYDLWPAEEAELLTKLKSKVLATGEGSRQEINITSRDGLRTMDLTLEPFKDANGNTVGLLGTAVDITGRKLREEGLRHSREQFRNLARHLQSLYEDQRELKSREIHDEVSQTLAALELELAGIAEMVSEGADASATRDRLREINEGLAATIQKTEKISSELRPSLLDNLGLASTIESWLLQYRDRTGMQVSIGPLERADLPPDTSTAVYRILQEALGHVERRGATRVKVSLCREGMGLVLQISDDGPGTSSDEEAVLGSLGLLGMQERARSFGGHVTLQDLPGTGSSLYVEIPTDVMPVVHGNGN